jgi:hypothetical protein
LWNRLGAILELDGNALMRPDVFRGIDLDKRAASDFLVYQIGFKIERTVVFEKGNSREKSVLMQEAEASSMHGMACKRETTRASKSDRFEHNSR